MPMLFGCSEQTGKGILRQQRANLPEHRNRSDGAKFRVEWATRPTVERTIDPLNDEHRSTRRQVAAGNGQVGRSTQTCCMVPPQVF